MTLVEEAISVKRLGRVPYAGTWEAMRSFTRERDESTPDELWLLEHPAVYTVGQGASLPKPSNAIPVVKTDRGGDVTYHGPGQVVGYPIVDLRPDRCDVHRYVRDLEEVMIRVCADHGVAAGRIPGLTGVWVGAEKIGAIGVRISRWITSHGFAFNVATDLEHFGLIVPCGIGDRSVTSLERATGRGVPLSSVEDAFVRRFAEVFDRTVAGAAVR